MLANVLHAINGVDPQEIPYKPHPSFVGAENRCLRATVYWRMGIPRTLADRAQILSCEHKALRELTLRTIREKSAYRLSCENTRVLCGLVEFMGNKEYPLEADIDGVLTDMMNRRYLLQIEPVVQKAFEELLKGETYLEELIKCCFLMKGAGLTQCVLLFKNKNTSAYLDFLLGYDSKADFLEILSVSSSRGELITPLENRFTGLYRAGIDWFEKVEECANSSILPPCSFSRTSWQCSYCSYGNLCRQDEGTYIKSVPMPWSSLVRRVSSREVRSPC
ncbi:MAG: hypothetical protein ACXWMV_10670 [Syntrophales bacterium]